MEKCDSAESTGAVAQHSTPLKQSRSEIVVEVAAVFILAVGLVKMVASIPAWGRISWILVSVIWVWVSFFILWLNEEKARTYGLTLEDWKTDVKTGLAASLILIPLFWVGCFFYWGVGGGGQ